MVTAPGYHVVPLPQRASTRSPTAKASASSSSSFLLFVIHCASTTDDMYASLDELTDTLARKLKKYKERKAATKQARRRESKLGLSESLIDEEGEDAALLQPRQLRLPLPAASSPSSRGT